MRKISIYLTAFNCACAIIGGGILMIDPSGESLNMPVKWLRHSPFHDYFIPGVLLFLLIGLGGLLTLVFTIYQKYYYQELCFLLGLGLTMWIVVQMFMLQTITLLHFILGLCGILLLYLGWQMIKARKRVAANKETS